MPSPARRFRPERPPQSDAARHLEEGRRQDAAGQMLDAMASYRTAVHLAELDGDRALMAEALRLLAIAHHRRQETAEARAQVERSYTVAQATRDPVLAACVLNTMASFDLETGDHDSALRLFTEALALGAQDPGLRGRIEQNLGVLANIHGDLDQAMGHYRGSLQAFQAAADSQGCAMAFHNLGMISADQGRWEEADGYYRESMAIAEAEENVHLQALCLLNRTEVALAQERFTDARTSVARALAIFERLGDTGGQAGAHRFLGIIHRNAGAGELAQASLERAVQLAGGRHPLEEAEAIRELALVHLNDGRNQQALEGLNRARRLFRRLSARGDQVDVAERVERLEQTFLAVVRDWGQSIESADAYTHGHCERVAAYAVSLAGALGLGPGEQTTIRVGAYLHDVGKMRVPSSILNKPGPLTADEFALVERHPVWGLELLAAIDFPWDIKPIIRWHHEKRDGSGYPDGLRGDEIPLAAQIICIADVYDALTTTRSYKPALPGAEAVAVLEQNHHWWIPDVYRAFVTSVLH